MNPYAKTAPICYSVVILGAALVLIGWHWDIPTLRSVVPGFVSMKANTAIGLTALAGAGFVRYRPPVSGFRRGLGGLLAVFALALAFLTLAEYLLGLNLGIDELLYKDPDAMGTRWPPGRFAPVTCINFTAIAAAILLEDVRHATIVKLRQALLLIAWIISFQAFIGYLSGVTYSFGSAFYTQIAIHTSVLFILLCSGLLLSRPAEGFMGIVLREDLPGRVSRLLLLAAILGPPLMNWVQLKGAAAGIWDADFGVLLRVVGNIVFFSWMAFQTGSLLAQAEHGRDLAEQRIRESEAQSRRAAEEARRALQARNELISVTSHEIKTPLTSLKLQAQSIRRSFLRGQLDALSPDRIARLVENNDQQITRLVRVVDEMLEFTRIEQGMLALHREAFDLREMVTEVTDRFREQLENAGAAPEIMHLESAPGRFDRFRLEQAYSNLLVNVLRYGRGRPIDIRVRRGRQEGSFQISVRDQGIGLASGDRERIFERFERAVSANEVSGLGLGLFITRRIVETHGGTVWAESEGLGHGCTFTMELPAAPGGAAT